MIILQEKLGKRDQKEVRSVRTIVSNIGVSRGTVKIRFEDFQGRHLFVTLEREDAVSLAESVSNASILSSEYHKEV